VTLAALRDSEVIQLLSQVIEDLVTGEILQARADPRRALAAERGAGMQELPVARQCLARQHLEAFVQNTVVTVGFGARTDLW
jgi:geranylgeranyl pyrophosphate synthase